MLETKF